MHLIGISASEGVAFGQAFIIRTASRCPQGNAMIKPSMVPSELKSFDAAVDQACRDLNNIHSSLLMENRKDDAEIIEVQMLLLKDAALISVARDKIKQLYYSSQLAIELTMKEIIKDIQLLDDDYLKERAVDVEDVCRRVIRNLRGEEEEFKALEDKAGLILLCDDLTPSEAVRLNPKVIAGLAMAAGGTMSHSAIITRSMGIPAVVGIKEGLLDIHDGQWLLLNGTEGLLMIDSYEALQCMYQKLIEFEKSEESSPDTHSFSLAEKESFPAVVSNIGSVAEAHTAKLNGADGVGLFRTEFLFMGREDFPSEDEQFEAYRAVISVFGQGAPIVIRTMDVGGDKQLSSLKLEREDNPFLGNRGIRISFQHLDQFRTQLRAALRASSCGNIKLLFPMISTMSEWRKAVAEVEAIKRELKEKGVSYNEKMEIGMMIEVPAAALMVSRLADEVDFFSIGTNDLIQYVMAASRTAAHLVELNDPLQPAVLRLIHNIITAAHEKGKKVGMCGEMAAHPLAAPLLLGMGLDEFSISGAAMLQMRSLLSQYDRALLRSIANTALSMDDAEEIKQYVACGLQFS